MIQPAEAQQTIADSLRSELMAHTAQDTVRIRLLVNLAKEITGTDPTYTLGLCDEAITQSRKFNTKKWEIKALMQKALALDKLNRVPMAKELLLQGYQLAIAISDSLEMGLMQANLGNICLNAGEAEEALRYFQNAESIFRSIGDLYRSSRAADMTGVCYSLLANYPKALSSHLKALAGLEELKRFPELANCHMNIGNVYNYLDEQEKSRESYRKSLEIYEKLHDLRGMANVKTNLGISYQDYFQDRSIACGYYADALEIFTLIGDRYTRLQPLVNMACLLNNLCESDFNEYLRNGIFKGLDQGILNQYEMSSKLLREALDLLNVRMNWGFYIYVMGTLGESMMYLNRYQEGLSCCFRALDVADSLNLMERKRETLNSISKIYERSGRYDSAYYFYRQCIAVRDSI